MRASTRGPLALSLALGACSSGVQHSARAVGDVHTLRQNYNNVHIIEGPQGAIVIDSGLEGDAATLRSRVISLGVDPRAIRAIVITHGHADHAGGADVLREWLDVPVIAGAGDRALFETGRNDRLCPTDARARRDLEEHQSTTYRPYPVDVWVDDVVDLAPHTGLEGQIAALPGHTAGSLVVVAGDVAFVGDLFRGSIVGHDAEIHFYMCDRAQNLRNIQTLLDTHPQVETFFTGHFGPVEREAVVELLRPAGEASP